MSQRFTQVDAFTPTPFAGNPAAVCVLDTPRERAWMQHVATEMNLSETAFLLRRHDGYSLRWFTPAVEVELCGHATLAACHVLWEDGHLAPGEEALLHTASGVLTATRQGEWISLDFPTRPERPVEPPPELIRALAVEPVYVGKNVYDYLVQVADEATVRALDPDQLTLKRLGVRGVIVTAVASTPGFDFVSRFFAPGAGVDEDPVTGSAHCCLGPFWQERLGKPELVAYQASRRGGTVRVRVAGDRVVLGGQAVTVARGEILA
ncbi:MAG: PhzF family phenazine biosynthesis protein [Acidobacteria bacterium]|nr:PhzF family phenazine biosynthesis protein [Acidobacteriota bacterium]